MEPANLSRIESNRVADFGVIESNPAPAEQNEKLLTLPIIARICLATIGVQETGGSRLRYKKSIWKQAVIYIVLVILMVRGVSMLSIFMKFHQHLLFVYDFLVLILNALFSIVVFRKMFPCMDKICDIYNTFLVYDDRKSHVNYTNRQLQIVCAIMFIVMAIVTAVVFWVLLAFYVPQSVGELEVIAAYFAIATHPLYTVPLCIHIAILVIYHMIVNVLRDDYEKIRMKMLQELSGKDRLPSLLENCRTHKSYCDHFKVISEVFSPFLLLAIVFYLLHLCQYVKDVFANSQYNITIIPLTFTFIVRLFWVCIKSQQLQNTAGQFASDILEVIGRDSSEKADGADYETLQYISIYHAHLLVNSPTVTVYGLFNVNMKLLLKMCGVVLTYTIILMGFDNN